MNPWANSSIFVLPTMIVPCSFSRAHEVASYGGMNESSIFDAAVVRISFVVSESLTEIGIPDRDVVGLSFFLSRRSASCRASSMVSVRNARMDFSCSSIDLLTIPMSSEYDRDPSQRRLCITGIGTSVMVS